MSDFDWVSARNECSIDKVFEKLRLDVKNDVEKRQELRERFHEFGFMNAFHFTTTIGKFSAAKQDREGTRSITFCNRRNRIVVLDTNDKEFMSGTLTLTDERECRIAVGQEVLEAWQFRKRALESLFFDEEERSS